MNVNELTLAQINQIVADMEGVQVQESLGRLHYRNRANDLCEYSPVTLWRLAGPIIEREHIMLDYRATGGGQWFAYTNRAQYDIGLQEFTGKTSLEAAMRCHAARHLPEDIAEAED